MDTILWTYNLVIFNILCTESRRCVRNWDFMSEKWFLKIIQNGEHLNFNHLGVEYAPRAAGSGALLAYTVDWIQLEPF